MLLLALALAAGTAAADTTAPASPPDDARAGMVAVHRQPAIPIAAVRLSVLADDPPGYAGAGHLLQHLLLPGLREQVRRVGGEIQATRSSDALVYTATGPASELDFLAGVLRSTLRPPRFTETQLASAARELRDERNAEWETASGHVRALLRAGIFPADLSPAGTAASAERFTADVIPALWAEMYRPERVAVVAVGDVQAGQVRSAFAQLPPAPDGGLSEWRVDTVAAAPPVSPEATRGWIGMGYSAADADPAALTVTARLLRAHLRERLPSASVEAEHWWTRQGQALGVVVAVPPAGLAAARRTVRASVASLTESLDPVRVRDAAAGVRREMLFHARRPERMAAVVGQFIDRSGDADAAQRFYDAVERVDEEAVRAVLAQLADRTPVAVDVPPPAAPGPEPMMRRSLPRSARALGAALLFLAAVPHALGAQDRVVVRPESGTPMVAMEVLIAAGPADETPEQAGLAYLTARAATRPIRPILDSLGAHLTLQAHKDALGFTLLAAPDAWREASRTLLVALFRDPADSVATVRERAALRAELIGREASPADALAREVDAAVFGPEHPWRRPAAGYSVTVEKLTLRDVDGFLRAHLVPERTVVAVVGPVDAAAAREHLAPFFRGTPWEAPRAEPPAPLDSPIRQEYSSITAWIAASYLFPADVDPDAVRLLGELAVEGLSFGPSRRSVYNARSEVLRRAEGGELRIQIVVPPREVDAWAGRIDAAVAQYAERALPSARFAERVRRYRGLRLRELDTPEARAQATAREALLGRDATGRLVSVDALDAEDLLAAARSLRPPTLVVLGPFVDPPSGGV